MTNPQNPNPQNPQNQNAGGQQGQPGQQGVQGQQPGQNGGNPQMPPQQGGYYQPAPQQPMQQPMGGQPGYYQGQQMPQGTPPGYMGQPGMGQGMTPGMGAPGQGMGMGGMQPGMQGGMPTPPPEDNTPANFQLGSKLPQVIDVKIPAHTLKFDEQSFLHLLAGSISLTKDEKKRIIDSIPKLKQSQVDELMRIFEEERRKFAELSAKHVEQLKKLEKQHMDEWNDIVLSQKSAEKKNVDQAQADEIRKKLGL